VYLVDRVADPIPDPRTNFVAKNITKFKNIFLTGKKKFEPVQKRL
jgi:hypothetical protein